MADLLRHGPTAGVEGSKERVEDRTESLCPEGAGCKARQGNEEQVMNNSPERIT